MTGSSKINQIALRFSGCFNVNKPKTCKFISLQGLRSKGVHTEFLILTLPFVVGLLLGCCQSKKEHQGAKNIPELFFDYQISGAEEKQDISLFLKFWLSQRHGKGMGIYGGKVFIDGVQINPDSSLNDGIYYEILHLYAII